MKPIDDKETAEKGESKDVKTKILSKYVEDEKLALMALDGFLLVLNDDGDITYVSENIGDILGLSKVWMDFAIIAIEFAKLQLSLSE